jgi:hypothetical protein
MWESKAKRPTWILIGASLKVQPMKSQRNVKHQSVFPPEIEQNQTQHFLKNNPSPFGKKINPPTSSANTENTQFQLKIKPKSNKRNKLMGTTKLQRIAWILTLLEPPPTEPQYRHHLRSAHWASSGVTIVEYEHVEGEFSQLQFSHIYYFHFFFKFLI